MLHDSISELIGLIYASAYDLEAWDSALAALVARTRSSGALVAPTDLDNGDLFNVSFHGPDSARVMDGVRDYIDHFHQFDPVLRWGVRNPHAGIATLSGAVSPDEQEKSDYVRWLTSLFGLRDVVTRYTTPRRGLSLAICLTPARGRDVHDANDLSLFETLFPHLNEAVQLAQRPVVMPEAAEPFILVDARGRVHELSDAAGQLLAEADGLGIEGGFLRASRKSEQARIDQALKSAMTVLEEGGVGGDFTLSRPSGRRPLLVRTTPLPVPTAAFEGLHPAALVSIVDPEAQPSSAAANRWATLFGLTPAEARLAAALLAGEGNLRTTAEALGIAYPTARVQLTSLFNKTGTHSQSQLSRLLSRLP